MRSKEALGWHGLTQLTRPGAADAGGYTVVPLLGGSNRAPGMIDFTLLPYGKGPIIEKLIYTLSRIWFSISKAGSVLFVESLGNVMPLDEHMKNSHETSVASRLAIPTQALTIGSLLDAAANQPPPFFSNQTVRSTAIWLINC